VCCNRHLFGHRSYADAVCFWFPSPCEAPLRLGSVCDEPSPQCKALGWGSLGGLFGEAASFLHVLMQCVTQQSAHLRGGKKAALPSAGGHSKSPFVEKASVPSEGSLSFDGFRNGEAMTI
jgi:hypothetical protein